MALPTFTADRWEVLQQRTYHHGDAPQHSLLLAALDQGWIVEAPVYLRPRWGDGGARVYHFLLRRPLLAGTRLITVPHNPLVEAFVRREGWTVIV